MAQLFTTPFQTTLDANANAVSGAQLQFYVSGTNTPTPVYADAELTTPLASPVIADSAGRFVPIYLNPQIKYRVVVADASGAVIRDVDPISDSAIADLADGDGLSLVGFTQNGTGATLRTALDKARETIDIDDFKLSSEAFYDNAIAKGIAYLITVGGGRIRFGRKPHLIADTIAFDTGNNNITIEFVGEGIGSTIEQTGAGKDLVRIGQTQRMRNSGIRFMNLIARPGAGHVVTVGAQGFEWFDLEMVDLEQRNIDKRVWNAPFGNMFYLNATGYWRAGQGATVSPVYIRAQDTTVNHNIIRVTAYNAFGAPFFDIANEALATWLLDNTIEGVMQNCPGGAIRLANANAWHCKFNMWDVNPDNGYTGHIIHALSNSGYESINCHISIKRNGSGMTAAFQDVKLEGGQDFTVTCLTPVTDQPKYDWGNKRVKVLGRAYNENNTAVRERDQVEQRIFVNTLAQSANADSVKIGGLVDLERATISGGGGFVQFQTTVPGTALILSALSGSSTPHQIVLQQDGAAFYPGTDNFTSGGLASNRFSQLFAGTSVIGTSDARMKDWRGGLTSDELAASKALSKVIGLYRWKDAVQDKGTDARLHVGVKAQQVVSIMQDHDLDPFAYGFVCYDEWEASDAVIQPARDAVVDSDGVEIHPASPEAIVKPAQAAGNRFGVRYEELAMFIAAGQEARLAALEAAVSGDS
ncbi:MAG: tail fiber domain-containing protein [Burkholderiales bacterium]